MNRSRHSVYGELKILILRNDRRELNSFISKLTALQGCIIQKIRYSPLINVIGKRLSGNNRGDNSFGRFFPGSAVLNQLFNGIQAQP